MGAEEVGIYDLPNLDKIAQSRENKAKLCQILCPEYLSEIVYIDFFVRYSIFEICQPGIEKSEIICN